MQNIALSRYLPLSAFSRDANNTYIRKTMRHLATRVKEHGTSQSAVKDHLSSCEMCKSE